MQDEAEEPSAPPSSRFDYDLMVKPAAEASTESAPKRGKDGHLTLDTNGILTNSHGHRLMLSPNTYPMCPVISFGGRGLHAVNIRFQHCRHPLVFRVTNMSAAVI